MLPRNRHSLRRLSPARLHPCLPLLACPAIATPPQPPASTKNFQLFYRRPGDRASGRLVLLDAVFQGYDRPAAFSQQCDFSVVWIENADLMPPELENHVAAGKLRRTVDRPPDKRRLQRQVYILTIHHVLAVQTASHPAKVELPTALVSTKSRNFATAANPNARRVGSGSAHVGKHDYLGRTRLFGFRSRDEIPAASSRTRPPQQERVLDS